MAKEEVRGEPRSRRSVLAVAAGGAAALAATALRPIGVDAAAANMQTETDNPTGAPTGVTNSTDGSLGLFGHAAADGTGIEGTSTTGIGAYGSSADISDPPNTPRNAGVVGVAGSFGEIAANIAQSGVYGYAGHSTTDGWVGVGVWGDSPDCGVAGTGTYGVAGFGPEGVVGSTGISTGIGVHAMTSVAAARALLVTGRAEFTRSGRSTISAGSASKAITLAGCTTSTLVFAVLASSRTGRWVRAVVPTTGKFTIYLNTSVSISTNVVWIAFTNPSNHSG